MINAPTDATTKATRRAFDTVGISDSASLIGWYRAGLDVHQRLPLLSTYLGHVDPATTYWYLSAVPELIELVADRLDTHQDRRS